MACIDLGGHVNVRKSRFQIVNSTLIIVFTLLISSLSFAKERCPSSESHSLSAVRYQLYTAYHMGFDGYEAPCSMKCLGKESCTQSCQTQKGLELLSQKMKKMGMTQCQSYSSVCMEQCATLGQSCVKACHLSENT